MKGVEDLYSQAVKTDHHDVRLCTWTIEAVGNKIHHSDTIIRWLLLHSTEEVVGGGGTNPIAMEAWGTGRRV